jgi:O-acetyl-ADP-ribose deacetylase (regulator of RNase III)
MELTRGNLLEADVEALVNTVNTVGVMGKGIALQFKRAFPDNFAAYKRESDARRLEIGRVFVYQVGGITNPRYIINFPTKRHWRERSRIEFIREGLQSLIEAIRTYGISSIAIPPLGCGNGGLHWNEVRLLIAEAMAQVPDVRALVYEPAGTPPAAQMVNRTERPDLTPGRAAVLALMKRYLVPGYLYRLSLLELQKLAYFLQIAGEPLRLKYEAFRYGPYADNLRHVLNRLEGHYIRGYGDGRNKPETPLELLPGVADEAENWLITQPTTRERLNRVAALIEGFETPYGMELLATVHWVAQKSKHATADVDIAVTNVRHWNARKAKFPPNHIRTAWERLKAYGWI